MSLPPASAFAYAGRPMTLESGAGGRLRLITDVLRSFADATTDYARLLQTIVERVAAVTGHACSIRLLTADEQKLATAALHDPLGDATFAQFAAYPIPIGPALRDALDRQRAYVEELVTQESIDEAHNRAAPPVTRVLVAPLVARGAALGCLFVVQRAAGEAPPPEPFTTEDVELVDALARHAALALANARLLTSLDAVERARAHERSILDTVDAPLLLLDPNGIVMDTNRACAKAFGIDETGMTGRSIFSIANGGLDTAATRTLLGELPPSRPLRDHDAEVTLETTDGERTFVLRTAKTYRPGNGSATTLVTLVDLTDRIKATTLARRQSLLIASMSEALIGMDRDFVVEEWNPAAERLFGWTADEVCGRPISDFFATTLDNDREENRKKLREGETVRAQVRIKNRAGEWVDVEFSTMPVVEQGETRGYVCVMLDVTARSRLEAELRTRVEELTTANAELESFSYSVSHDLRAPVRAIDGFSEILEQEHTEQLDEEGRRMLGLVRRNAKRMGLLIDDLLALARYSRQPLVEELVDMHALAHASLEEVLRGEPQREVATTIGPLPPIRGDESLLHQVWLNLHANAVKYTRGRAAAIETSAAETDDEVIYVVKDNGAGFDMRHAGKLFGTFERLHTAKEFEGTGIGLALVARIVRRHGGRVWGHGEVDRGATFSFALPKKKEGS